MIRVAFLSPSMHFGGAERWILTLARQFTHCVPCGLVLTEPCYHPDILRLARQLMPIEVCEYGDSPVAIRQKAARICETADVLISWGDQRLKDIVSDGHRNPNVTCPVVEVSHSDGEWTEQANIVEQSYVGATHLAAVSCAAVSAFPADVQEAVTVIPNGVEMDRLTPTMFKAGYRQVLGIHEHFQKIVLFLGRLTEVKNPVKLLRTLPHLPDEWAIVFAGNGALSGDLKHIAERLGEDRVYFVPPQVHVGDLLNLADVLALPSQSEGHPLTANEAWLTSTPVVCTDFGFAQEINKRHGEMMRVIPQDATCEEFARVLVSSAAQTDEISTVRMRAYATAWANYTAAAMTRRWEEYLFDVVKTQYSKKLYGCAG